MTMSGDKFCNATAGAIADYLFQELKIHPRRDYRVASATSGPRVLTLALVLNPRHAPKVASLAEQLSMAAGLSGDASIRVSRGDRGTLSLEVPKPPSLWFDLPVSALPRRRGLLAPIGIDVTHRPALLDFADPLTPHVLVAGATGSGKTNAARLFVYDLASQNGPDDVKLVLLDTRKRGAAWRPFARLPHLLNPVVTSDEEALGVLAWTVAEIDRRASDGRRTPALFLGVDESQALLDREEFTRPIVDIAATGREFGVHLCLCTQNPTAEQIGTAALKRNLSARLVGKVDSATAAQVAAGIGGTGAELLAGPGDQLLLLPSGVRRITAALVSDKDTDRLPAVDEVGTLDLGEYEDIDHVLGQVDVKAPDLEPEHVAFALAYPDESQRALYDRFRVGFPRIKRAQQFARDVLGELEALGFGICNAATGATGPGRRKPLP